MNFNNFHSQAGKVGKRLRTGIAGAGYFGRLHALKAASLPEIELAGLYDPDSEKMGQVAGETGSRAFPSLEALLGEVDAVVVAAPAAAHAPLSLQSLAAGKHVLVEKPLALTPEEGKLMIAAAKKSGLVLQVGHLLRYSPEREAIARHLPSALYFEATRLTSFHQRGTDVSVILDLMIHDLDMILSLVNSPVIRADAMGAAVASEHEDIANARVVFENGCVATLAASRISFRPQRKLRVFGRAGYLSADFMERKMRVITRESGGIKLPGTEGFRHAVYSWDKGDELLAEQKAFVRSCLYGEKVEVDGEAGLRALSAAKLIAESMDCAQIRLRSSGLL